MDRSEQLVERYLRAQGFSNIVYEPDGNVTPDFLVDGRIAIEVRRLNQNHETDEGSRGLEEVATPLDKMVRRVLAEIKRPTSGPSWFVLYTFCRPLPPLKELARSLGNRLEAFDGRQAGWTSIVIDRHFSIRLVRAVRPHANVFVIGGSADDDSGGMVLSEMRRNLAICLAEKGRKVTKVRDKYPTWWFVLVDYIGYGLDHDERDGLRDLVTIEEPWDKIVLVNPVNPETALEL